MLLKSSFKLLMRFWLLLTIVSFSSFASDPLDAIFKKQQEFLDVDDAFQFSYQQKGNKVELNWLVADGYYMYADKFQFAVEHAELGEVKKPSATQIEDEFFGVTDVYFFNADLEVEVSDIQENAVLSVRYQGCAKAGLCYNPTVKKINLETVADNQDMVAALASAEETSSQKESANKTESVSSQNQLADALSNQSLLWTLLIFFGLGAGLAFTPCVFPMFPILSGIIAGQQNLTTRKGLYLAFIYVQGMALTYSLLGLVIASMGSQFQGYLQHPSVLIAVSILFVFLAASMFGWINLQLPQSWTSKLTEVSNKQKSGNVTGVFLMGALSGLIASPCTTAPLTGALLYVAQTGDLFIGFITLYVLSLGMGLPLLLIGASGGNLLPKAGNWMNVVKVVFGFILLTIPLILLDRIVDEQWVMLGAGVLALIFAAYMHSQYLQTEKPGVKSGFWLTKNAILVLGLILVFKPLIVSENTTHTAVAASAEEEGHFKLVKTIADIEQAVAEAGQQNKIVMLDLYADWCIACKEFEKYTFPDPTVKSQMSRMVLLQVDMTENSDADIEILEQYSVFGLPTIMFFDTNGNELTANRVTGFLGPEEFSQHLNNLL